MSTLRRIESLDYLRGLLALGVLAYHFYLWSGGRAEPLAGPFGHALLYRTGIYAVLMFYVISGASFGYVYRDLPLWPPLHPSSGDRWVR